MSFLQDNSKGISVHMRHKKKKEEDEGLNLKNLVFTDPVNQITLK